ncbi:MAG: CpsD/CapB family tyrosine-protein kinase [Bacillus sp. (in: firmicutes)]
MIFKKKNNTARPQESLTSKLIVKNNPKSPISEQYRTIRTNVEFLEIDKEMQVLMVSSTKPGEGKSLTVSNLGAAFAQQGKKVLLIDADLRKPTLHRYFDANHSVGLTNVLVKQTGLLEVAEHTGEDKLFILTSGPIPPNPAELLGTKTMQELIGQAREEFDVIIFDTPPLLAVSDAKIIAKYSDGVILVIASGMTEAEQAKKAKDIIESTGTPLLGTVLNKKKEKTDMSYGYYGTEEN